MACILTACAHAQGYDGVANMAGIHRGVQAIIRYRVPDAVYVHCKAHSWNLVRNMLGTLQQLAFEFHYSAKPVGVSGVFVSRCDRKG